MRENLRSARKAKGMTQQAMADALEIHDRYYKALESGEKLGSIALWDSIEDILGINQRVLREICPGKEDNR